MIKDVKYWEQWEADLERTLKPDLNKNLRMVEAMVEEARQLGAWPPADPLEDLDAVIRVAEAINAV